EDENEILQDEGSSDSDSPDAGSEEETGHPEAAGLEAEINTIELPEAPLMVSEIAAQPPAEPQPELAAAVEAAEESLGASAIAVPTGPGPHTEWSAGAAAPPEVESPDTAEDTAAAPADAAEPESECSEAVEAVEEALAAEGFAAEESRAGDGEPSESA